MVAAVALGVSVPGVEGQDGFVGVPASQPNVAISCCYPPPGWLAGSLMEVLYGAALFAGRAS